MGAWGTGPYDNDSAADMLGDLADELTPKLLAWLKSGDLYDVRTAAWVMGQLGVSGYTSGSWHDERDDLDGLSMFDYAVKQLHACAKNERREGYPDFADACIEQAANLESVKSGYLATPGLLSKIAGLIQ